MGAPPASLNSPLICISRSVKLSLEASCLGVEGAPLLVS